MMISFPGALSLWCCVSFFSHDFFLVVARPCVGLPPTRTRAFDNQNAPTARAKPLILAVWWWPGSQMMPGPELWVDRRPQ